MRKLAIFVAVLVCAGKALAQEAATPAAPNANKFSRPVPKLMFGTPGKSVAQRPWYWEVDDSIHPPFPTYRYLRGTMTQDEGFSPVALTWNFSGKHPLMPALELAGMQLKPGERMAFLGHPTDHYGTVVSDQNRLWSKASHALIAALHY